MGHAIGYAPQWEVSLLRWFVLERNLQMAGFIDFDDQGHAAFRTAHGKWFARVFV